MSKSKLHRGLFTASFVLTLAVSGSAGAAGFAILEQSAEGVGTAFAGAATGFGDGSEIFFNPGAITGMESTTISGGVHFIVPSAKFSNAGSVTNPLVGGAPLSGGNGPDGGELGVVPNLYVVHPVSEKLSLGFGFNAPFGLATEYDRNWVGRYQAIKSRLTTLQFTPAAAYKFGDRISVGVGLNILYADAELTNAIDFGTVGLSTLGAAAALPLGFVPQGLDGVGKVEGDDWGVGVTAGMLVEVDDKTKLGLSWRSKMNLTLSGNASFEVPAAAAALTATGAFTDTGAEAGIELPESILFGASREITDGFALLADIQWTRWSRFKELRVKFDSVQPDSVVDESWQNVWRFSVGGICTVVPDWTFRAGWTFDEEPIPNANHRTPRIPGNDRNWLALGVGYAFSDALRADLSYAHLFIGNARSRTTDSFGHTLIGDWDLATDIASFSIAYDLG